MLFVRVPGYDTGWLCYWQGSYRLKEHGCVAEWTEGASSPERSVLSDRRREMRKF